MLKEFFKKIGKAFLSPAPYIIIGTVTATTLVYQGCLILFGDGLALIILGLIIMSLTFALSMSVSRGE